MEIGAARKTQTRLSGIVLAGGHSQRMGCDKAFIDLDGRPLISRILDKLARFCDELIISANQAEPFGGLPARVVPDVIPERGALSGIHAGLKAMRNERAVVVACDMPFLSLSLLRFMAAISPGYDAVVPRIGKYYEPLHAVYSADCVGPIQELVAAGPRRIVSLYDRVVVREVTEDEVRLFGASLSFVNVNTPEDWENVERLRCARA